MTAWHINLCWVFGKYGRKHYLSSTFKFQFRKIKYIYFYIKNQVYRIFIIYPTHISPPPFLHKNRICIHVVIEFWTKQTPATTNVRHVTASRVLGVRARERERSMESKKRNLKWFRNKIGVEFSKCYYDHYGLVW